MPGTRPPEPGGAQTLAPKPATTSPDRAPQTFVIGGAAEPPPSGEDTTLHPFSFRASDYQLWDLRRRIADTIWPDRETVGDATQGVQLATMQKLAGYWATEYDWGRAEARLNSYPNFITDIDRLDIHFIHVKSRHPNALPVIVTHGWPGSVIELLKIIDPLTDPTAHGGNAGDAFDVVIPSLPGFGLSGKPKTAGWAPERIARVWDRLMTRLGYDRYVAQGGDWGAMIVDLMGVQAPSGLLGIHTNMAGAVPADIDKAAFGGHPPPADLSAEETLAYEHLSDFYRHGLAYAQEMGNRPQTLYGLADSPIGLAAWILDHDIRSYQLIARVFDGKQEGLTKDDILDNITLYWLTNTAVSAARIYWENKLSFVGPKGAKVPAAVSVFPDEIYTVSRKWAERAYPRLVHYNRLPKGGHFAAWEQPAAFADELRTAFRSLRS